jgi:hypothetical protein
VDRISGEASGQRFCLGLGLGADGDLVGGELLTVAHRDPPGNHDGLDLVAAGGVDQVGYNVARRAIVVDTTSRPTVEGNPFVYFPQELIEQQGDEDAQRMVREYDPTRVFIPNGSPDNPSGWSAVTLERSDNGFAGCRSVVTAGSRIRRGP